MHVFLLEFEVLLGVLSSVCQCMLVILKPSQVTKVTYCVARSPIPLQVVPCPQAR